MPRLCADTYPVFPAHTFFSKLPPPPVRAMCLRRRAAGGAPSVCQWSAYRTVTSLRRSHAREARLRKGWLVKERGAAEAAAASMEPCMHAFSGIPRVAILRRVAPPVPLPAPSAAAAQHNSTRATEQPPSLAALVDLVHPFQVRCQAVIAPSPPRPLCAATTAAAAATAASLPSCEPPAHLLLDPLPLSNLHSAPGWYCHAGWQAWGRSGRASSAR